MTPSLYQHQRLEHRRGRGSPSLAAVCDAQVPAAHDKAQVGSIQVPGRSSPVRTGGGFGPRLFSHSRCAPVSLAVMRLRRQANVAPPSVRLVASKFCAALLIGRSHQRFRTGHYACKHIANSPESHSCRRLSRRSERWSNGASSLRSRPPNPGYRPRAEAITTDFKHGRTNK